VNFSTTRRFLTPSGNRNVEKIKGKANGFIGGYTEVEISAVQRYRAKLDKNSKRHLVVVPE
jgi:hypothetical protein